jgi:hypothetical protein
MGLGMLAGSGWFGFDETTIHSPGQSRMGIISRRGCKDELVRIGIARSALAMVQNMMEAGLVDYGYEAEG